MAYVENKIKYRNLGSMSLVYNYYALAIKNKHTVIKLIYY